MGSPACRCIRPARLSRQPTARSFSSRTSSGINGLSPDGRWLGIYQPYMRTLYIHRLPGLERTARLASPARISDFQFSPDGDEVAIASGRGLEFWSTKTWERTRQLTNAARQIIYEPDARLVWVIHDIRTAGLYDARSLEPRLLLPSSMLPLAVSPDGRHLAVSVDNRRLQIWDLAQVRQQLNDLGLDWPDPP